jgi:hypothetical protein
MRDCWAEQPDDRPNIGKVLVRLENIKLEGETDPPVQNSNKYAARFIAEQGNK